MDRNRFDQLMRDENLELTKEELAAGWHFCVDFDGLLMEIGAMGCNCTHAGIK